MHQSYFFEDFVFPLCEFFSLERVECRIEVEKFVSSEVFIEIGILRHESYLITDFRIIDRASEDLHFSFGRSHDTKYTLHRRRLSCTIWPKKSEDFTLLQEKLDIGKEGCFLDFFREVDHLESMAHIRK